MHPPSESGQCLVLGRRTPYKAAVPYMGVPPVGDDYTHCNAKPLALGVRVGQYPQRETFALPISKKPCGPNVKHHGPNAKHHGPNASPNAS